jgi:hypothetical protein
MSNFIPLPPTYAVSDPQVRAVLDVLTRNMQVVIEAGGGTTTNTALTTIGGGSSFGSPNTSTNITNLAPSYTLDTLTADLKRGAAEVITGALNGTTIMKLEPAGQYVVFQHKDAIVLGNTGAYAGTVRTALGITSTGILGGYNRQSDGAWQTTFAIESATGNLTLLGTIRAASVISVDAYLGSTLVSDVVNNAAAVTTKLNKSAADILSGTIEFQSAGGFKTGTIVVDGSGNATGAGVAITSKGIVGRTDAATTFTIDATTGAATFKGDITGASGTFTGTVQSAASGNRVILNESSSSYIKVYDSGGGTIFSVLGVGGLYANSSMNGASAIAALNVTNASGYSGNAITGTNNGSGHGILGNATSTGTTRSGVVGISAGTGSGAPGVAATNLGGYGLYCSGLFGINNSTLVTNLNADYLDGNHASAFMLTGSTASDSNALGGYSPSSWARIFPTNSGTANAGGAGLNLLGSGSTGIAGAYVGTSGSGNTVTFAVQTTSPSDVRLKEEITNIDVGLAFVNQLRPVSYKLKADPRHQKGYGFIADEVEQLGVYGSSLVYEEPDWQVGDQVGFKTIHYPSYVAVLTKAIQELSAKVAVLESSNAS